MACDLLTACQFNGHLLKADLRKKNEMAVELVTVLLSKELVVALAKANTHGAVFTVMSGDHFTLEDMFKAAQLPAKRVRIEELIKEKSKG